MIDVAVRNRKRFFFESAVSELAADPESPGREESNAPIFYFY
jgi:hypothetical protein